MLGKSKQSYLESKMTSILQGTPEWLEAKQSKISASEIFSLVLHYCRSELEAMGFDLKEERSFRTIQELFLKVKFDAKLSEIDPVHSEFGNGMEAYVAYRFHQESGIEARRSKEFIINEDLHSLAACSPDGYCEISHGCEIDDFDKTCKINSSDAWKQGALELKTANYFANFGSDKGSRLNYIFQLQFQMMVMELMWGCLAVLMPKEKQFDEPFFKGKVLAQFQLLGNFDCIDEYYDLKYYIYPELPVFQAMIMKALNAFQEALDGYDNDQSLFPRNSEDLAGLQREKQMWAQLWPLHYGVKELDGEEELNKLLNERYQAQVEKLFAEQSCDKITNEIYQKVKANGLDKFCEIRGTENRMSWIKNGQVRFYKLKEAKA